MVEPEATAPRHQFLDRLLLTQVAAAVVVTLHQLLKLAVLVEREAAAREETEAQLPQGQQLPQILVAAEAVVDMHHLLPTQAAQAAPASSSSSTPYPFNLS